MVYAVGNFHKSGGILVEIFWMRIGLISDTHGLLRAEALTALAGSDLILHAGDIGSAAILEGLGSIAPVHAVRGNNDSQRDWPDLHNHLFFKLNGVSILMIHERAHLSEKMLVQQPEIVVCGHSHKPMLEQRDGITYLNPGAAGKKRFSLPISVALLHAENGGWEVRFINLLDERPLP